MYASLHVYSLASWNMFDNFVWPNMPFWHILYCVISELFHSCGCVLIFIHAYSLQECNGTTDILPNFYDWSEIFWYCPIYWECQNLTLSSEFQVVITRNWNSFAHWISKLVGEILQALLDSHFFAIEKYISVWPAVVNWILYSFVTALLALQAFSVAILTVWNSLPDLLRDPAVESERFRRDLKMHLFAWH